MISVKVDIKTPLLQVDKINAVINQETRRAMTESVALGETVVAEMTPVGATGHLRQGIVGEVETAVSGRIYPSGPGGKYAAIVENGRRPGKFPPPDAIEYWLKRSNKGKAFVAKIQADYGIKKASTALKAATFLKSRGIAKYGTKAVEMFKKGEKKIRPQVQRFFDNAIARIERRLSD